MLLSESGARKLMGLVDNSLGEGLPATQPQPRSESEWV